eukprot:6184678-Pleurochrysis_carterae.AAC.1
MLPAVACIQRTPMRAVSSRWRVSTERTQTCLFDACATANARARAQVRLGSLCVRVRVRACAPLSHSQSLFLRDSSPLQVQSRSPACT